MINPKRLVNEIITLQRYGQNTLWNLFREFHNRTDPLNRKLARKKRIAKVTLVRMYNLKQTSEIGLTKQPSCCFALDCLWWCSVLLAVSF